MSNVQIPNLPAVASLSGAELFEAVQSGVSVKVSVSQVTAASAGSAAQAAASAAAASVSAAEADASAASADSFATAAQNSATSASGSASSASASATSAQGSAASASSSASSASTSAASASSSLAAIQEIASSAPFHAFPSTSAALSNGVVATTGIVGGSGGTNGQFDVAFSGGGATVQATARFTVAGGALTSIVILSPGYGYTSAPTMSFSASSGLAGASATAVIGQNQAPGTYFTTMKDVPLVATRDWQNVAAVPTPLGARYDATVESLNAQFPAGLIGLYFPTSNSTSPQSNLPNNLASQPITANLCRGRTPADDCTISAGQTLGGDGLIGPDGSTPNATWFNMVGAFQIYFCKGASFPAGTYTVAFSARSHNGGSNQQFRIKVGTTVTATVTATSAWQTFVFTGVSTVGVGQQIYIDNVGGGTTGISIDMANARVFPGSVDYGPTPVLYDGSFLLGTSIGGALPTFSGQYADFSSGAIGLVEWPWNMTLTGYTVVTVARKAVDSATLQAMVTKGFVPGSGQPYPYQEFTAYFEVDGKPSPSAGNFDGQYLNLFNPYNKGWHVFGVMQDSAGGKLYIDGGQFCSQTSSYTGSAPTPFSSTVVERMYIGAINTYNTPVNTGYWLQYQIAAMAIFNRSLTAAEYNNVRSILLTQTGVSTSAVRVYCAEGDSITRGDVGGVNHSYANKFGLNASPAVLGRNNAVSGSMISATAPFSLNLRAPYVDAMIDTSNPSNKFIFSVLIGVNDYPTYSSNLAGYLSALAAYCDARRAAGWKVILCTLLPTTISGFNAWRNSANTTMRTWVGTHCDAICDFGADPIMGPDAAASDLTLYQDGVHPTALGQTYLEADIRPVINAF